MTEAGLAVQPSQASSVGSRVLRSVDLIALLAMVAAFITLVALQLGPALIGLKTFSGVDILTGFRPLG